MLIIVDLQEGFPEQALIAERCLQEFSIAYDKGETILCLASFERFADDGGRPILGRYGELIPELLERTNKLSKLPNRRVFVWMKEGLDGSGLVECQIKRPAFAGEVPFPEVFRVCGLYTHKCVFDTVVGLRARFPEVPIEILKDAVTIWRGENYAHLQEEYLLRMANLPNVKLV